jgi:hypothetical protein
LPRRLELTRSPPAAPRRSGKLSAQLDGLEASIRDGGGGGDDGSSSARAAAQHVLVSTVLPELRQLRLFVVLNYTAVVKARPGAKGPAACGTWENGPTAAVCLPAGCEQRVGKIQAASRRCIRPFSSARE